MCELTGLWEFLHCIRILNHHVVHFKYITICQLHLNKAEKQPMIKKRKAMNM